MGVLGGKRYFPLSRNELRGFDMAGTSATSSSSAASAPPTTEGAPESIQTGYMPGTPTGGGATSTPPVSRDLNKTSVFATEASPAAQVMRINTFQNEFPDDSSQFQSVQEAKRAAVAEARAAKIPPPNYGLVQNPETGEYEWAPWTDAAGSTDNATAASKENFDGSTYTAYSSTDVEDTLVAYSETEKSEKGETSGSEEPYYGEIDEGDEKV